MKLTTLRPFLFSAFMLACCAATPVRAERAGRGFSGDLDRLASAEHGTTAISVVDVSSGKPVYARLADKPLKPASILKLVTAAAALRHLGPEYRFTTELLGTLPPGAANYRQIETLYLRGHGDPTFTIESLWLAARQLKNLGVRSVGSVVLDDSYFLESGARHGQRAFETGASALAFNFNSVGFEICPTAPGRQAIVALEPSEFPVRITGKVVTASSLPDGIGVTEQTAAPGGAAYLVRGRILAGGECRLIYRSVADPVSYLGQVLLPVFRTGGIQIAKGFSRGVAPANAKLLYTHRSKALSHVIEDMNHFSNNFIGEQLVYALGGSQGGAAPLKASRALGLELMRSLLQSVRVPAAQFVLNDGSGLSHDNRLSASAVTAVLLEMQRDELLRPEFESSLSIGGLSGTLRKRRFGTGTLVVRAKTGTLDGVSSLAGYVLSKRGIRYAFSVIQNGASGPDAAHDFEEKIVEALYSKG